MAQILKNEIKDQIKQAAKQEFLSYGFKDASMRRIALASKTSLGNLYRYFKSKEDVCQEIVSPTLGLVDNLLLASTNNSVSFDNDDFTLNLSTQQLKDAFLHLSAGLIDIYQKHKIEFSILILNSQLNKRIEQWFIKLTKYIIYQNNEHNEIFSSLATVYASSAFNGLKQLFQDNKLSVEQLKTTLDLFMLNYIDSINKKIEVNYE